MKSQSRQTTTANQANCFSSQHSSVAIVSSAPAEGKTHETVSPLIEDTSPVGFWMSARLRLDRDQNCREVPYNDLAFSSVKALGSPMPLVEKHGGVLIFTLVRLRYREVTGQIQKYCGSPLKVSETR